MLELAQNDEAVALEHTFFDANPYLLNLSNGIVDLKSNEFFPHKPEFLLTKVAPVKYSGEDDCISFFSFLNVIFDNNLELIEYVQRAIGLSLCGAHLEEALFFCFGSGKNGKSVFFNILKHLLGDYHQKAPTEMLMMRMNDSIPNDIARLPGARIVVAAELPENRVLNENRVKDLTGGDSITARFLHKEFFDFVPTHTLWIYGNHKPIIKGTDRGIWRRFNLIPFTVTIPKEVQRPMHDLMSDLLYELPGIFNWAVEGWKQYLKMGLNPPDIVRKATQDYKQEQDKLSDFIDEFCILSPQEKIEAAELYKIYIEFCKENTEYPITKPKFYRSLLEKDVKIEPGKGNKKFLIGIGLNNEHTNQQKAF
jgi:putative DNA primase/helicase